MNESVSLQPETKPFKETQHKLETCYVKDLMEMADELINDIYEQIKGKTIKKYAIIALNNSENNEPMGNAYVTFDCKTRKVLQVDFKSDDDSLQMNLIMNNKKNHLQKEPRNCNNEFYNIFKDYSEIKYSSSVTRDATGLSKINITNNNNTIVIDAHFGILNRKLVFTPSGEFVHTSSYDTIIQSKKNSGSINKNIESNTFDRLISDADIIRQINNMYKKVEFRRDLGGRKFYNPVSKAKGNTINRISELYNLSIN